MIFSSILIKTTISTLSKEIMIQIWSQFSRIETTQSHWNMLKIPITIAWKICTIRGKMTRLQRRSNARSILRRADTRTPLSEWMREKQIVLSNSGLKIWTWCKGRAYHRPELRKWLTRNAKPRQLWKYQKRMINQRQEYIKVISLFFRRVLQWFQKLKMMRMLRTEINKDRKQIKTNENTGSWEMIIISFQRTNQDCKWCKIESFGRRMIYYF